MADIPNMSREEMEAALEKAKKAWQETLDKMTPEEREQAMRKAQQLIDEDQAARDQLMAEAAASLCGAMPQQKP